MLPYQVKKNGKKQKTRKKILKNFVKLYLQEKCASVTFYWSEKQMRNFDFKILYFPLMQHYVNVQCSKLLCRYCNSKALMISISNGGTFKSQDHCQMSQLKLSFQGTTIMGYPRGIKLICRCAKDEDLYLITRFTARIFWLNLIANFKILATLKNKTKTVNSIVVYCSHWTFIRMFDSDPFWRGKKTCMNFARSLSSPGLKCELQARYLSIYLSIYISNYLSIYLSIYLRREQLNQITHWMDGSNIYGSTTEDAMYLR